ncbi:SH3 domain-containing protein [Anaerococcus hydrogenalis]|uniref:SH3 domain-containing protein n=1 Tax=Anaerococcus hydrogenalis TaxID=33029 RepID=A0A2N6UIU2_9FIRM|nr:SH3 domain-containing protein [Anaerococcus hydrogenalis]MDK7694956.1 SH3 domain-containing protein [Anaerococcus hydrogenalis]MDK7696490.1 SH3 domain-containing protein [Anaerococcus hydrogenalis]MDK7707983.1 SH3 domain-containing protein [Anaerococcus hydrogenalis]PMC81588.1 SH3 domain-containing protein [Anaerococcus hydrogenalis]
MKIKYILCSFALLLALSSCDKKQEKYEKRDVQIDTVFDSSSNNISNEVEEKDASNVKENAKSNTESKDLRTKSTINLRRGPSTNEDNIIASIPGNSQVKLLSEEEDENGEMWSRIFYGGQEGYVKSDLLEK